MGKNKNRKQPSLPVNIDELHEVENYVESTEEVEEVVEVLEPEFTFPTYTTNQVGIVIPHMLKVRKSCSTDSDVLTLLRKDDEVEILDENTCNGWLPVLLEDGTKGYCMSKFIK